MSEHIEKNNDIELDLTTEETPAEESRPVTRRYNKRGKRRGKYAYAAPVGFLVSLLSIVGVVAIIVSLVGYIRTKNDDTALRKELYYYLEPLLVYSPDPFSDAAEQEQDAFLNAAAYRVMLAEQNRMLMEGDEYPKYDVELDMNCYIVPVEVVEESYAALFGSKAKLTHRTIEDSGIEYSETDGCYYIPYWEANTGYEIVIDTVKQRKDSYEVRVGFVPVGDIKYDEHGETIPPTVEQATHFQTYTLTRDKDAGAYYIKSCEDK